MINITAEDLLIGANDLADDFDEFKNNVYSFMNVARKFMNDADTKKDSKEWVDLFISVRDDLDDLVTTMSDFADSNDIS